MSEVGRRAEEHEKSRAKTIEERVEAAEGHWTEVFYKRLNSSLDRQAEELRQRPAPSSGPMTAEEIRALINQIIDEKLSAPEWASGPSSPVVAAMMAVAQVDDLAARLNASVRKNDELWVRIDRALATVEWLERKWNPDTHDSGEAVLLYPGEVVILRAALEGEAK